MNKGFKIVSQFLGNVSTKLRIKLEHWKGVFDGGKLVMREHSASKTGLSRGLSYHRKMRTLGSVSAVALITLSISIVFPLSIRSEDKNVEAATGTATDSSISFTSTRNTATVNLTPASTSGTFAKTTSGSTDAAFSITTTNSQGYELKIKGSGTVLKPSTSTADADGLAAVASSRAEGSFAVNTWGYLPSYYNSSTNSTTYYPITTSDVTLRKTAAANSTAHSYTIGLGAKADFTKTNGTYTLGGNSGTMTLSYVANPTSYSISFDKGNAAGTPSDMPAAQSGSVSATSVALSSNTPTLTGYSFTGWCMGTVTTTAGVDSCTGTGSKTFAAGANFGIDRTASNSVTLHAMWSGNQYTATIYYNSNATSGSTTVSSTTASCRVTGTADSCTISADNIPSAVKDSVGTYNNAYVGVASSTGTMSSATTITLSANANRYAVYRTAVTLYKPSATNARTSVALYRNQWFTSTTALSTTVLSNSTTGTSNYAYSSSVSGYALYGFSASTNTSTRTYTAISALAPLTTTTFYAIDYDSDGASATFYYNNNTTTNSCTTANVASTTGYAARYLYTTSSAATTTSGESISVPSAVSNSKGTCGMAYKNVGTSTSNMTAASPTAGNTYYARYSGSVTNYYYNSGYTSRTLYRNQWVSGTSASSISTIVLATSDTGSTAKDNYTTAGGPGATAASWAGLATSSTTTPTWTSVANAATASSVYSTLYTIYQFNITYSSSGSTGVSSIGASSGNCKVNATGATAGGTSCSVTLPSISVESGYESLGWGTTSGHTGAGTAAGSSYTLSTSGTTLYANAKSSKLYMQNFTASTCSGLTQNTNYTVYDSRDENSYTVAKLADGYCWMTQNLRLGKGNGETITLTSANSNVTSNFTLKASGMGSNKPDATGDCNVGDWYPSSTAQYLDVSHLCINTNDTNKYGVYYNWYTATAGTGTYSMSSGNASGSICPKGWILPPNSGERSYYNLLTTKLSLSGSAGSTTMQGTPYNFPLSGNTYGAGVDNVGTYGVFWSSSASNSTYAYYLNFNSSSIDPQGNYGDKGYGFSVRCVFGS